MDKFKVVSYNEADYKSHKPIPGHEPFAVVWGAEGWVIWCKVIVKERAKKVRHGKD